MESITKSSKRSLWCSKSYHHVHSADEETEAQSLFKVTEVGWILYIKPVGYLHPKKAHDFSFFASRSLSPWVWASPNLPTKMFPSAFLVSLDSTRLKALLEKWVSIPFGEVSFHPLLSFLPPSTFLPGSFTHYHFTSSSPLFSLYKRIRKKKKKCIQRLVRISQNAVHQNGLPYFSFPKEWWSKPNRCWLFFPPRKYNIF